MGNKPARIKTMGKEDDRIIKETNEKSAEEIVPDMAEFYYDIGKRLLLGKEEGMEVNRNVMMALDYLQRAVEAGHGAAEWDLACLVKDGDTFRLDFTQAVQLYKKHSELDDKMAHTNLGVCYHKGRGIEKDPKKAVSLYEKGVALGYPRAMYNLALCYDFGEGVEPDCSKAVDLYHRAARGGYAVAQHYMGVCYFHGKGVVQDFTKAIAMWAQAARQGHPYATSCMGESYRDGQGVDKNLVEAARSFAACSAWGIEEGWQCLMELLEGQYVDKEEGKWVPCFYERKMTTEEKYHVPKLYDQLCLSFHKAWAKNGETTKREALNLPAEVTERVKYGASTCISPNCGKYYYGLPRVERHFVLCQKQGGTEDPEDDVVLAFCSVKCSRYDASSTPTQPGEDQPLQQVQPQQVTSAQPALPLQALSQILNYYATNSTPPTNNNNNNR